MHTNLKFERGLVCCLVNLRVVCIRESLHECIPIPWMLVDVVSNRHKDDLFESPGSAVRLWMVRCCWQMFSSEEGAHCSKTFAHELSTIASEYVCCVVENIEPITKRDICNVRCCCPGH